MANEIAAIEKFIVARLGADAALQSLIGSRIFAYQIPAGKAFPAILFAYLAGADTQGTGVRRQMLRARYQIKAIGRGNLNADLIAVANRIDELFQNCAGIVFENATFSARREQPVSYREPGGEADASFRHLGGIYRIDCY